MARLWKESELEIIRNSQNRVPEVRGRSRNAVRDKMVSLGLLKTNKHWTYREIELIKSGVLEIEGRTRLAVRLKRKKLGLLKNSRWKKEEIELLKSGRSVPGRSVSGIRKKLVDLGISKKRSYRPDWTTKDLDKLKELCSFGKKARDIFEMGIFDCSLNAIQKKMCRLGLADRIENFKRFPEEIRNKCKKFLLENWEGKTPEELTNIWNIENHVWRANKNRIISYLMDLKIKIPYGEVHRMNSLRKKEQKLSFSGGSSSDVLERVRSERVKLMSERLEKNRDIWTGLPLLEGVLDEVGF